MDFEQIRAFINVASLKSFSEAAEKMFISQPSVSVRIKTLEEELGVILLDRSKAREPSLTEAGKIFLDYSQAVMNLKDECLEKLSGQISDTAGLVHIGASTVPGTYMLPGILARLKNRWSTMDYNLVILDTSAVLEGVLNYSYDLGFVGLLREDERLKYIRLSEDELVLCAPKGLLDHSVLAESGVSLEVLASHHLIMREKGSATRTLLEKKLKESNFDWQSLPGITYINSLEGMKQAVKEGLGLAVFSKLSVSDLAESGAVDTFRIKDLDMRRFFYLVYHHSRVLGGAARRFRDCVIDEFTN